MNRLIAGMVVLLGGFVGCASTTIDPSGFLGDARTYAAMQPDPDNEGVQLYSATRFPLAGYDNFIVPPVAIYLNAKGRERGIADADLEELAQNFRAAVIQELGARYQVSNLPTQKTAILRMAITDADPNLPILNIHPGSLTIGGGLGGASAEVEVIDAATGRRIAVFMASSKGKRYEYVSGLTKWGHTNAVLEDWARLLGERVQKAHG